MLGLLAAAGLGLAFGVGAAIGGMLAAWAWATIVEWRIGSD